MNENFRRIRGYDNTSSAVVPAGSPGTVLLTERLAGGAALLVTHFGNYIGGLSDAAWGSISWTVRINGIAVPGFEDIKDQLGTPQQLRELSEPFLVRGGDLLEVIGKNTSLDNYGVGVSLQGSYGAVRR